VCPQTFVSWLFVVVVVVVCFFPSASVYIYPSPWVLARSYPPAPAVNILLAIWTNARQNRGFVDKLAME